jgi:GNAT superfamily N-acetyltransferase
MTDSFLYTTPLDVRAKPLIDELTYEYSTRYGNYFGEGAGTEMTRYPAEVFAPPDGNFVLLMRHGVAIGGGAFKRYDERTAEFKRIWTRNDLRRRGLARRVLEELEAQALRQGYARVYLTTGFRQPEATGLYLTSGYTALFDTSVDPEVHGKLPFEKDLDRALVDAGVSARATPASRAFASGAP